DISRALGNRFPAHKQPTESPLYFLPVSKTSRHQVANQAPAMKRRKHAADGHVNTEGWMMSYADMATTLLAMFIVLSTMGKDQTGVSLYNGTGSFFHALDTLGLGGNFTASAKAIQFDAYGPKYQL